MAMAGGRAMWLQTSMCTVSPISPSHQAMRGANAACSRARPVIACQLQDSPWQRQRTAGNPRCEAEHSTAVAASWTAAAPADGQWGLTQRCSPSTPGAHLHRLLVWRHIPGLWQICCQLAARALCGELGRRLIRVCRHQAVSLIAADGVDCSSRAARTQYDILPGLLAPSKRWRGLQLCCAASCSTGSGAQPAVPCLHAASRGQPWHAATGRRPGCRCAPARYRMSDWPSGSRAMQSSSEDRRVGCCEVVTRSRAASCCLTPSSASSSRPRLTVDAHRSHHPVCCSAPRRALRTRPVRACGARAGLDGGSRPCLPAPAAAARRSAPPRA